MMPQHVPPSSQKLEQLLLEEREARETLEKELAQTRTNLVKAEKRFNETLEKQSRKLEQAQHQARAQTKSAQSLD